jgi:cell division protein ZapA
VAQVTVSINGRQFRMACEDGQEGHLARLAEQFDQRIGALRSQFGEIGDARLTVMAALMVADELSETVRRLTKAQDDLAALQNARVIAADSDHATQAAMVQAFHTAAARIEDLAKRLARPPTDGESVAMG